MTNATVLLAKGLDADNNHVEVRGTPFYRLGRTCTAYSIQAVQEADLLQVPAYLLGEGRVAAGRAAEAFGNIRYALQEPVWSTWYDTFGETDTLLDEKGILGNGGQLYVASFQNGGLFVHNHQRIQDAIFGRNGERITTDAFLQLKQEEVDTILDAVRTYDARALHQMGVLPSDAAYVFKNYEEFVDISAENEFTRDMPSYLVLRTSEAATRNLSGDQAIEVQRVNEDLAIAFAGPRRAGAVLDVAQKFGWTTFGSHHRGYGDPNSGRVVFVDPRMKGVFSVSAVGYDACAVGVTLEAIAERAKIVNPLELTVVSSEH